MLCLLSRQSIRFGACRRFITQTPRTKRKPGLYAYALLVLPASCVALGCWQINRRRWKLDLLDKIARNINNPPIELPSNVNASIELPEFLPVTVRGQFDHSHEVLIGPRSLIEDLLPANVFASGGKVMRPALTDHLESSVQQRRHRNSSPMANRTGYCVVTPFKLSNRPGESILVNRGWVHTDMRDPATRQDGQVKGTVEISGLVRHPEQPPRTRSVQTVWNCVDKENQHPQIQFSCRQIDNMAEELNTLPFLIDASYDSSTPGGPIGGQTRVNLRNEHASYIFTWFTLAAVGSGIWVTFFLL